jgi:hypothetical protein
MIRIRLPRNGKFPRIKHALAELSRCVKRLARACLVYKGSKGKNFNTIRACLVI